MPIGDSRIVRGSGLGRIEPRQPKVEDLDPTVLCYEDVFRLEVAVNDPGIVRGREPSHQFHASIEHVPQPHGSFAKAMAQRFSLE